MAGCPKYFRQPSKCISILPALAAEVLWPFGRTSLDRSPDVLTNRMKAVDARTVTIYDGSRLHDSSIPGHLVIKSQSSASDSGA